MFDVHYYLAGMHVPEYYRKCVTHLTGGNFYPFPGEYLLPEREGLCRVYPHDGILHIQMNTRGSGESYNHPLTLVTEPLDEINSGWYSWIRCKKLLGDMITSINHVPAPTNRVKTNHFITWVIKGHTQKPIKESR